MAADFSACYAVAMDQSVNLSGLAPISVACVANQLLALGERDKIEISPMKLQKLLFYAHAWHLAINNKPLFEEDFEAWPYGPVVRDVYSQTRRFGMGQVTARIAHLERTGDSPLSWRYVIPAKIQDSELNDFLEAVWDSHKNLSAIQLSNSTHAPGEPWTIVKEQYGNLDSKPTIPNALIASVFKAKLARNADQNTDA